MQDKFKSLFLKFITLMAVFCLFYPALVVARSCLFNTPSGTGLLAFDLLLAISGFILAFLLVRKDSTILFTFLAYITAIVPVFLTGLIFNESGLPRAIFESSAAFFFYFTGTRTHFLSYDSVISFAKVLPAIVLNFAALYIEFNYPSYAFLKATTFSFLYVFFVLFIIVLNQVNLDDAMERKGVNSSVAPKKIRFFNISMTIILFALLPVLLNIRNILHSVSGFFSVIPQGLIQGLKKSVSVLSSSNSGDSSNSTAAAHTPGSALPLDSNPANQHISSTAEGTSQNAGVTLTAITPKNTLDLPHIILTMSWIISLVLACYIVMKIIRSGILKDFARGVHYIAQRYFAKFINFFKTHFLKFHTYREEEGDYVDEIEFEKPSLSKGMNIISAERMHRKNKLDELNTARKIRRLYSSILKMLVVKSIRIVRSDTTGEIYIKSSDIEILKSDLQNVTEIYDKVRYDDEIPDNSDLSAFQGWYRNISDKLKEL